VKCLCWDKYLAPQRKNPSRRTPRFHCAGNPCKPSNRWLPPQAMYLGTLSSRGTCDTSSYLQGTQFQSCQSQIDPPAEGDRPEVDTRVSIKERLGWDPISDVAARSRQFIPTCFRWFREADQERQTAASRVVRLSRNLVACLASLR
jgi:hypothetical protein